MKIFVKEESINPFISRMMLMGTVNLGKTCCSLSFFSNVSADRQKVVKTTCISTVHLTSHSLLLLARLCAVHTHLRDLVNILLCIRKVGFED